MFFSGEHSLNSHNMLFSDYPRQSFGRLCLTFCIHKRSRISHVKVYTCTRAYNIFNIYGCCYLHNLANPMLLSTCMTLTRMSEGIRYEHTYGQTMHMHPYVKLNVLVTVAQADLAPHSR